MFATRLYGCMGFLSLLGFVGLFTEARSFLAFFAFAVDFSYFFIQVDEMRLASIHRAAAWAFFAGMFATAVGALWQFLSQGAPERALLTGLALGWAVAVFVHAALTAFWSFRESYHGRED